MKRVSVRGHVYGDRAVIALLAGRDPEADPLQNVALKITFLPIEHRIVCNSCKNGTWSVDESVDVPSLSTLEDFVLDIVCKKEHFDVQFNSETIRIYEHHHGFKPQHVTELYIDGDVTIFERNLQ
jgi:hypothetical protein